MPKARRPLSAEGLTGIDGLAKAVAIVDAELDRVLHENLATLDAYPATVRRLPGFQTLEKTMLTDAARTFYRMGRREIARGLWQQSLAIDRLDVQVLQNIAVCDTISARDHARTLQSWKAYAAVLYFQAIAAGNPRVAAGTRAAFHRKFASAFSGGAIREGKEPQDAKVDRSSNFLTLINTPGMLAELVEHKRAELLNKLLELRTPTLLFGVKRTGKQEARAEGKQKLQAFIDSVTADLPERVAAPFAKVCAAHLDATLAACADPKQLTEERNPHCKEEEAKLVRTIADFYELKWQLFVHFRAKTEGEGWQHAVKSLDFLAILERLDVVPLAQDPDILRAAVAGLAHGNKVTPDKMLELLDSYLDEVVEMVVVVINHSKNTALFERLARHLVAHAAFWKRMMVRLGKRDLAVYIDEGQLLYSQDVIDVFKGNKQSAADMEKAISALATSSNQYPAVTGPARLLARLFSRVDRRADAVPYLEQAIEHGVSRRRRRRMQAPAIRGQRRRGGEGAPAQRGLPVGAPGSAGPDRQGAGECRQASRVAAGLREVGGEEAARQRCHRERADRRHPPRPRRGRAGLRGAGAHRGHAREHRHGPGQPAGAAREGRGRGCGEPEGRRQLGEVAAVARAIEAADPTYVEAVRLLAICMSRIGGAKLKRQDRLGAKVDLQQAVTLAERVLADGNAPKDTKSELREMRDQIKQALAVL